MNNQDNKNKPILYYSINDSFAPCFLDNVFTVFKSIDKILILIFANKNKSIITYNIIDNKRINEIKNAHKNYITNFRYFFDKINRKDLIISISAYSNNIKLWDINNCACLLDLKNINKTGYLNSASFLKDNNNIYIITSNFYYYGSESIKIFDLKGNLIKEINNSNEKTYFIDSYYDNQLNKNYILTGNVGYVKSYDYNENKLYHKYEDNNKRMHYSIIIYYNNNIIKLIESSLDGYIRIWNFHLGELLDKIKVCDKGLNSIILKNNEQLIVGCEDKTIKIIELKANLIENIIIPKHNIITIKFITDSIGDILLFQGLENNPISLWIINI